MLNITHGLVGATIATQPISPFLSLPAAFFSHFLLDVIPHCDSGTGLKKHSVLISFLAALIDGLIAMLATYLVFQKDRPFNTLAWLGMFTGMGQDFLDAPTTFFNFPDLFPSTALHRLFHDGEKNFFWGMLPQAIIILICLKIALG